MRRTHLYANSLACRPASFLPFTTVYLLALTHARGIGILKGKKKRKTPAVQSISSTSAAIIFILPSHFWPLLKLQARHNFQGSLSQILKSCFVHLGKT